MPTQERVSVFPNMTKEKADKINKLVEAKQDLEYGALMILQDLHRLGLRNMLLRAVEYGHLEQEQVTDFYGNEDAGHHISGLTIDRLLDKWSETTNNMLREMSSK